MERQPQNIQEGFLNSARKEKLSVTIYLLSGVKLTGRIRSFDKFAVVLDSNHQEQLIFKHAISTVSPARQVTVGTRPSRGPISHGGGNSSHGGSGNGNSGEDA